MVVFGLFTEAKRFREREKRTDTRGRGGNIKKECAWGWMIGVDFRFSGHSDQKQQEMNYMKYNLSTSRTRSKRNISL